MKSVLRDLYPRIKQSRCPRWMTRGAHGWAIDSLRSVALGDHRRNTRAVEVLATLASRPTDSIPQATGNWSKAKSAYRFVENKYVSAPPLVRSVCESTVRNARGESVVLLPQDTTCLEFPKAKVIGLGRVASGKKTTLGLFLHSTLALTEDGVPIGLMDAQTWTRTEAAPPKDSKAERERPIEEKESFCWIESMRAAHRAFEALPADERPRLVHVGDRGEDFYEALLEIVRLGDSCIVRCSQNRCVLTEDGRETHAHEAVRATPVLARRNLRVPRHEKHPARTAVVELRAVSLLVPPPKSQPCDSGPLLPVGLVEVFEPNPPDTVEEPLHWLLWTFEPIDTLGQVLRVIKGYKFRWRIEDYHLILKTGCRVQPAQFETLERLCTIIALYAPVAVFLLRWRDLARAHPDWPCTVILGDLEWRTLLIATSGGRPVARDRPPPTLHEASLLIGRLGGHLNRKSDGPPGVTTHWRGWRDLMLLTDFHEHLLHP